MQGCQDESPAPSLPRGGLPGTLSAFPGQVAAAGGGHGDNFFVLRAHTSRFSGCTEMLGDTAPPCPGADTAGHRGAQPPCFSGGFGRKEDPPQPPLQTTGEDLTCYGSPDFRS